MWYFLLFCAITAAVTKAGVSSRIVGGQEADVNEHPFICSLQSGVLLNVTFSHICGCVIYNPNTIVTAAHCVDNLLTTILLRIVCGLHRLSQNLIAPNQQIRLIESITKHPQWNATGDGFPNDIATIRLRQPLTFNNYVSSIPFAQSGDFTGQQGKLLGWGYLQGGTNQVSDVLMTVAITVISNNECASRWESVPGVVVNDGHICFRDDNKGACSGDSGGPAVYNGLLVGITSWGEENCDGTFPSVYTRVSYFSNWIADNSY